MALQKIRTKYSSLWLNGWGLDEEGHLVYIPLWDPAKVLTQALKALLIADATREAAKTVTDTKLADGLRSISAGYVGRISKLMADDIWPCGTPPIPHPWPWPHSPLGVIISEIPSVNAKNAITGMLVTKLGEMAGDKEIIKIGALIGR